MSDLIGAFSSWRLPNERELSPTNKLDLDERTAVANFLGKDLAQACELFEEHPMYYGDDLMYVGSYAFNYYLVAFLQSVVSGRACTADALSTLLMVLNFRIECGEQFPMTRGLLVDALNRILESYDKYEVPSKIYGDLDKEILQIRDVIVRGVP